jgi:hypothetical protein
MHKGILFCHKKNEILSLVAILTEMEDIILSEIRQVQKNKY